MSIYLGDVLHEVIQQIIEEDPGFYLSKNLINY